MTFNHSKNIKCFLSKVTCKLTALKITK